MTMHVLIVGGSRADRLRAALAWEHSGSFRPSSRIVLDPATLPFRRPSRADLPGSEPRLLRVDDLETAFSFDTSSNLRLILTQSTYTMQKWIDVLGPDDRIVATADRDLLARNAPEALSRRGPWRFFTIIEAARQEEQKTTAEDAELAENRILEHSAISANSAVDFNAQIASVVKLLHQANVLRERGDVEGAHMALEKAAELTPEWEAVHYEAGKYWLACDDMPRARDAFQRAADLMPAFSAALSNLGATLGELDQPEAAATAFSKALQHDPESFTILNNLGVLHREMGRLDESERALLRVTELAPAFVFGYYNLGHTRFLRGAYQAALEAYEEGQRRDPEKNRRQGCRLALVRFALDDVDGAERELWRFADQAPPDEREDLLIEAYEIAQALVRAHPALAARQRFLDRIAAEFTV